jgi:hypothetical protein
MFWSDLRTFKANHIAPYHEAIGLHPCATSWHDGEYREGPVTDILDKISSSTKGTRSIKETMPDAPTIRSNNASSL